MLSTFGETPKRANTKNDGFPSFVWDRSASRRVRRLRPKTRLAGAGEALSYPPGALRSAEFVLELRAALRGWRVGFMFENVVMQPAAAKEVSDCLGVEPILVCDLSLRLRLRLDFPAEALVDLG